MIALILMATVKVGYGWETVGKHLFKFYFGFGIAMLIDIQVFIFCIIGTGLFWGPIYDEY